MATVKYNATTGKKLSSGEKTTDAKGNTYTQGQSFSAPSTGTGGTKSAIQRVITDSGTYNIASSANADDFISSLAGGKPQVAETPPETPGLTPPTSQIPVQTPMNPGATPQVPFDQALKNLGPNASSQQKGALAQTYQNKYQQAHQQLAGTPMPNEVGAAKGLATSTMNQISPLQEDTSAVDMMLSENKDFQALGKMFNDYYSPNNQKSSLMDSYKKLYKQSGLDELDEEIIDAKTIIEGTEDDIRNEVQMAGGFGTDSQVQALALSRNKSLLKNYNNLVAMREMKQNNLDTMVDLTEKDRVYADQKFDRMVNFGMQIVNYRDKFIQNARDQYNKYTPQQLQSMLAGNPNQLRYAEEILGVGKGGIEKLANAPLSEEAQLDLDYKKEQILNMKAQRANIYSDIAARNADNTVMVDQNGKVLLPQKEGMKINKEIANTDAFKAITKGKDSLQFLNEFESLFKETGATSAVWSPRQNSKLKTKYNTAILNLKEFFNLGVLNGPDEAILRGVLPDPTNRSATLNVLSAGIYNPATATKSGIDNMKKMIESSLDERYKSLTSQYGDYSGQSVGAVRDLNRIYVDQKSKVNPEVQKLIQENPDLTEDDIIMILSE